MIVSLPRLTDFIEEAKRAGVPGNVTGPAIRLMRTRRAGRRILPTQWMGTRLTMQADGAVFVWYWERDFHVGPDGEPVTAEQRNRMEVFRRVQELVEAVLKATFPAHKLRPGVIALPKDTELVAGEPDVLRFSKDNDGLLSVALLPEWAPQEEAKRAS